MIIILVISYGSYEVHENFDTKRNIIQCRIFVEMYHGDVLDKNLDQQPTHASSIHIVLPLPISIT